MRPLNLSLLHLRRRPAKAVLLLLGLAVGAAIVAALLATSWTMRGAIGEELRAGGTTVQVAAPRRQWTLTYAGLPVGAASQEVEDLPAGTLSRLEAALATWQRDEAGWGASGSAGRDGGSGVDGSGANDEVVVGPKLLRVTTGPDGRDVLVAGVAWAAERLLRPYWQLSGDYPRGETEVVLGASLAELWQSRPGGAIRLFGRSYRVSGVLDAAGQEEDGLVFMPLTALARVLGRPEALTFIEVRARVDLPRQRRWHDRLAAALPGAEVTLVRNAAQARLDLLDRIESFTPLAAAVAIVAGVLLVAASQFSAVRERTREVGVLRALGWSTRHVVEVLLGEVAILGSAAGILGYLGGVGAARLLLPLLDNLTNASDVRWYPVLGVLVWAGSLAVSLISAYLPTRQGARTDPAEALRFL